MYCSTVILNRFSFQCNSNQFTCQSGACIDITQRCNKVVDCEDFSDENNCHRIGYQGKTYKKKIPPKVDEAEKLKVQVNITIESLSKINELDMIFTARVLLQIQWKDGRLYFNDLNDGVDILDPNEMKEIWRPPLILSNSVQMLYILDNPHLFVQLWKKSSGTLVHERNLHESIRFKGSENDIVMTARFETEFHCNYKLGNYPFDSQQCHIEILVGQNIKDDVQLIPGAFIDSSVPGSTPQFSRDLMQIKPSDNGTLLKGIIEFRRMPQFHIYCTYLPTFCIICICIITLYTDEQHLEMSIMVCLTAMLVLYTLFQGTSAEIPSTAYLKLIDIWLIFSLVMPFIAFLILSVWIIWPIQKNATVKTIKIGVITKPMPVDKGLIVDKRRQKCKSICQLVVPITFLLFFFLYALFAFLVWSKIIQ